jgi:hypothetical protein
MAVSNTANYVSAAATPVAAGALALAAGWPAALGLAAVAACAALLTLRGLREGVPAWAAAPRS